MLDAIGPLASRLSEVNPAGGGIYVDLLNIQWWQAVVALLVALGLSPAPWLTAMATGRLLFRGDLAERIAERDKAHAAALAERDRTHAAALAERDRYHAALLAAHEARYADLETSNTRNVEAAQQERQRADKATATLESVAEALEANSHIMAALRDVGAEATK